jgi:hypothetical protein
MNDPFAPLQQYFDAEKQGALWCLALGAVAVGLTIWLWRAHGPFRAMAIPLALIGLVQLGIGVGLLARTDGQVATLKRELTASPGPAKAKELGRMENVNRSFTIIEIAELVLIATGAALAMALRGKTGGAVGMGILAQASVMLIFDLFAEHRALEYTDWLRRLAP